MRPRLVLLAVLLGLLAPPAHAHAVLLAAQPPDRSVVEQSPATIALAFNEPVQLTRLQLVTADGTIVRADGSWPLAPEIVWTLPSSLENGTWLLSYSVLSADSHIVSGSTQFAIGAGGAEFADIEAADDGLTEYPRFLMLAATVLAAGLLLAPALIGRGTRAPPLRLLLAATALAAAGAGLLVYLTALAAGGGPTAWAASVRILGPGALATIAALALGAAAARSGRRRVAALLAVAALLGLGLIGHVTDSTSWLSRPTHALHAAMAALWLGSLVLLLLADRRARAGGSGRTDLARFSAIAPAMLAGLVASGAILVALQLGSLQALAVSRYTLILAAKLGLVILLLVLAAYNRWRLTGPVLAGDAGAGIRLRRSIVWELGLLGLILAATALLGTAVPPRALGAKAACPVEGPLSVDGRDIGLNVTLTLASACAGPNDIAVVMAWDDDRPLEIEEVRLRFSLPELDVEPFDVYLERTGADSFAIDSFDLPLPGEWRVESRILLDAFTLRRVVFRAPLE